MNIFKWLFVAFSFFIVLPGPVLAEDIADATLVFAFRGKIAQLDVPSRTLRFAPIFERGGPIPLTLLDRSRIVFSLNGLHELDLYSGQTKFIGWGADPYYFAPKNTLIYTKNDPSNRRILVFSKLGNISTDSTRMSSGSYVAGASVVGISNEEVVFLDSSDQRLKGYRLDNYSTRDFGIRSCVPIGWRGLASQIVCLTATPDGSYETMLIGADGGDQVRIEELHRMVSVAYSTTLDAVIFTRPARGLMLGERRDLFMMSLKTRVTELLLEGGGYVTPGHIVVIDARLQEPN